MRTEIPGVVALTVVSMVIEVIKSAEADQMALGLHASAPHQLFPNG